ncbi:MAG: HAD family hydrolase [Alicyclobacillaceae bacterium]|nr:HAD family hydrolase [Alicyclobacillaceae bacterium]
MSVDTLLFDLDGTLLPMDLNEFLQGYFSAIIPHVRHLVAPESFVQHVWQATMDMMRNEDPTSTNLAVFKQRFLSESGLREEDIWPIFDKFFRDSFGELQRLTRPTNIAREICRCALYKGYRLVLATNPIFPEEAVRQRMHWAGVGDVPFALVTTMEHMHFCKPNPKYYIEILDRLGLQPKQCMMFGNDVQEDGAAGFVGISTFLVTDCLVDHGLGHYEFMHTGSLEDVLHFVQRLPDRTRSE